jgi:hypothetical protein
MKRRRHLARARRKGDLAAYRQDERQRQRACRRRRQSASSNPCQPIAAAVSRTTLSPQTTDLHEVILENWDKESRRSRACLSRQLRIVLRENGLNLRPAET